MKVLYVTGSDYSSLMFENDKYLSIEKAVKRCEENNGSFSIYNDEYSADFKLYEFGEVDPKFIDFIEDKFIDYDHSKNSNYYIIS